MLSNASEIRTSASRTALDLHTAAVSVLTTPFDRSSLDASATHSNFVDHHRDAVSPLPSSQADLSCNVRRQSKTDDRNPALALDPDRSSPTWSHLSKAAIAPALSPGTYSIQVVNGSNETDPTSSVSSAITTTGRSLADAYPINTVSNPQTINGSIGAVVTDHYYRFALETTSNLNLSLSALTADADLQLIQDANSNGIVDPGEVLVGSSNPSTQLESIAIGLAAGTYFIHVYQYSGDTSYALNAVATPLAAPPGYDLAYGYGLVDAKAAITSAIGQSLPAIAPGSTSNAWDLNLVNAPAAWASGYTGQGIVVAVVDTGVDATHPDLKDNIWTNLREISGNGIDDDGNGFIDDVQGWDFVDRDNTPTDLNGHGTHVAGTIAAEQNGFGVTGVAYNAKLMPVRVLGLDGGGTSDVAAGIRYAADNGANVINLSLGGGASSAIADAVRYAMQKGALVVMAAGNDGGSQPTFPANLANQWGLAVGAIDINEKLANFSDRAGASPLNYVVAPGDSILSTTPNNTYQSYSGTSMATPHVSGVAALILSANPNLKPAQLISLLTTDATLQGLTV